MDSLDRRSYRARMAFASQVLCGTFALCAPSYASLSLTARSFGVESRLFALGLVEVQFSAAMWSNAMVWFLTAIAPSSRGTAKGPAGQMVPQIRTKLGIVRRGDVS